MATIMEGCQGRPKTPTISEKICPNCGSVRNGGENFCAICGTERPKEPKPPCCPICGRPVKAGDAFCRDCGAKL